MSPTIAAPVPLFSWTADVIVPIILAMTIGAVLAIYTGLIASRIFAFYQVRAKALSWWFSVHECVTGCGDDPNNFVAALVKGSYPLCIELRSLGHEDAMAGLLSLSDDLNAAACHVCNTPMPENSVPQLPQLTAEQMLRFKQIIGHYHNKRLNPAAGKIGGLRPSLLALLSPFPFPNYLTYKGGYIGLKVRRLSWWELLLRRAKEPKESEKK